MDNIIIKNTTTPNTIRYRVQLNAAASKSAEREVYTGVVDVKETYDLDLVAKRMVERGCVAGKSTIHLVLTDFADLVSDLVAEGRAVTIPGLVRFAPSIRGTFETIDSPWDAANNQVVVNASIGSRMRAAAAKSTVQRVDTITLPELELLVDVATQQPNVITSEGVFIVSGTQLLWDETAEDEGFFLNAGGEETKCTQQEETQDETCAILKTSQIFDEAGLPVELFFRTRINGTLHQIKYANAITSAIEA